MEDERIIDLYWQRKEEAVHETERKFGHYLTKIAYNILADWVQPPHWSADSRSHP